MLVRILTLAALVSGCGPDDIPDEGAVDGGLEPGNPAGEDRADLVDLAGSDPRFSTLVELIALAGIADPLRGEGPYTVFAPTDEAFDALGVDLAALSPEALAEVLSYHVVPGVLASDTVRRREQSMAGYTLFLRTDGGFRVNEAPVVEADLEARNGVVHAIDQVLLPPTITHALRFAGLGGLDAAIREVDPVLGAVLASDGRYTVFAPSDDALGAAADLPREQLADVLEYHVFAQELRSDDLPDKADSLLTNPWGHGVSATFDTWNGVVVNEQARVIDADIVATNGIVHVIDGVLTPPTVAELAGHARLHELAAALDAADLTATLSDEGPFTLFAPTDVAFAAAGVDPAEDVLLYHVVGGEVPLVSSELARGDLRTLLGEDLTVDRRGGLWVGGAEVVTADVHATNGVMHVIDRVLVPPSL